MKPRSVRDWLFLPLLGSLVALGLLALLAGAVIASDVNDSPNDDFEDNEVVVKLDLTAGVTITDINAAYNTTTTQVLLASAGIYLLQTSSLDDETELSDLLENDPRLIYAEPNFIGEAPEADPSNVYAWGGDASPQPFTAQYAPGMLNLAWAHDIGQGDGVIVAVLDTGVMLDHPQLAASLTADRYDYVDDDAQPEDASNGLDDDGDGRIDEAAGHGTHVAGIVHLTAPQAQIMPLRVLDSDGRGNIFLVAEALLFAAEHGADVINLSLGTTRQSDLLLDVLDDLQDQEIVIVAAAGNLNSDIAQYPAAAQDVLAVTAVDSAGLKSSFANYGNWVSVAAPGEAIFSTFPISGYAYWSGTSMAAPFVAGQAALIRGVAPDLKGQDVETLIRSTAQSLDASNPGHAGQLGAGLPDVGASMGCHWADLWPDDSHDILDNHCDGAIDVRDITVQAERWGETGDNARPFDHNNDGAVTVADLMLVAARWSQ